jgi:hypothetical protein
MLRTPEKNKHNALRSNRCTSRTMGLEAVEHLGDSEPVHAGMNEEVLNPGLEHPPQPDAVDQDQEGHK